MPNVTFDEEPQYAPMRSASVSAAKQGSITKLMFKLGLAKTEKDASVVMVSIVVVCVILSGTVLVVLQPHAHAVDQAKFQADLARMRATTNTPIPQTP